VDYVYEKYTDQTDDTFASGNLLAVYEWAFAENNKFVQSVEVYQDFKEEEENFQIESITSLVSKLNSYFSLKSSYQVNHQTNPVDDEKEETDTILTVALVADF
jgi:putative salt-induced outer membrane protein YdiY